MLVSGTIDHFGLEFQYQMVGCVSIPTIIIIVIY